MGQCGEKLKSVRVEKGLTLREFCRILGRDVGNLSKIERGIMPPPQDEEVILDYCRALGFGADSDEAAELISLAAVDAGIIPKRLMDDKEVLKKIPIFFRTIDGKRLSREKLFEFLDRIKEV